MFNSRIFVCTISINDCTQTVQFLNLNENEGIEFGFNCLFKQKKEVSADSLTKLFLTLSTKHYAAEPLIQEIVSKLQEALANCKDSFIFSIINDSNLGEEDKTRVLQLYNSSCIEFTSALNRETGFLRSTYCRKKHQNKLNLNLPIDVTLLNDDGWDSGCRYSYIPFLDTLAWMLNDPGIRVYFENIKLKDNKRMMYDIDDGEIVKSNEIMKNYPNVIQIIIFQDAFEICNPLGASKTKFKMIAVYVVFLNLPPYLRTKKGNIQLVLLCLESTLKKVGWEKVLEKFINDLKVLETEGITIIINGEPKTFMGTLIVVLGDNLGSHQIGGYIESFGKSLYFCRYCTISRDDFKKNVFVKRKLRTIEEYERCVSVVKRKGGNEMGIKRDSPLNKLTTFHSQRGLPPCLAHDRSF